MKLCEGVYISLLCVACLIKTIDVNAETVGEAFQQELSETMPETAPGTLPGTLPQTLPQTLFDEVSRAQKVYQAPSREIMFQAERLFSRLLSGPLTPTLKASAEKLGFTVVEANKAFPYIALYTAENRRLGWGAYFIRERTDSSILLQVPHQFYDRHTAKFALAHLRNSNLKALNLNLVPRYYKNSADKRYNADLAHRKDNLFLSFARAFSSHYVAGYVLQLHGFSKDKRKTLAGKSADIILSNGTSWITHPINKLQPCFSQLASWHVKRYPLDVGELGATRNETGKTLRQLSHLNFIHIELSAVVRKQLLNSPSLQNKFWLCTKNL